MPPPATPAALAAPAATAQEESGSIMRSLIQGVAIFLAAQFVMGQFTGKKPATVTMKDASGNVVSMPANTEGIPPYEERPDSLNEGAIFSPIPQRIAPMWPQGSALDIVIVVSPTFVQDPLAKISKERIIVEEKSFKVGNFSDKRVVDTSFVVPKEVQINGTLWGHFYIGRAGSKLDPSIPGYDPTRAFHFVYPLTHYIPKKKAHKTKNLLRASNVTEESQEEDPPSGPIIKSFYHPNITMSIIPDSGTMLWPALHPAVRQYVHLDVTGARDGSGQNGWYYPILFVNTFWQLKAHMVELNDTVTRLPFHVDLNNQKNWIFSIIATIDEGNKVNERQIANGGPAPAGGDGSEFEMIKGILLDTNVYLLATTVIVSVLHTVFEMLAFKSDISHWRNKKDNVGISVRTILGNVFMQTVIFLYLLDNNENTSWMILFGQGMGIVLELWKVTKTVNVRIRPMPDSIIPYRITFEDKHKLSETEEKTKEYDAIAFKYLYMVAVPLLLAYAVYSVIYEEHKSWYSFIITWLVGSVYAYGFLMMVPSLYINYRLKSVAHMPAKAMTYKFLNTFIDDLFAFTIKMPTLHRLATLRDDVIFFVYLYQNYKYKIDYTRVNEFGQGGDSEEPEANKALTAAPAASVSVQIGKQDTTEASGSRVRKGAATKRK